MDIIITILAKIYYVIALICLTLRSVWWKITGTGWKFYSISDEERVDFKTDMEIRKKFFK